jgi:hypothetical protein
MLEVVENIYLFRNIFWSPSKVEHKQPRWPRCSAPSEVLEKIFAQRNLAIAVWGYGWG